jgi:predicted nuclease of predicted toxin-antitoxin system
MAIPANAVKLLLDENLSRRMLPDLAALFPGSSQVQLLGLEEVDDRTFWRYAGAHGFTLVTLDSDFHELATLYGPPPKIVWLKCGNRPRQYVARLLCQHHRLLSVFNDDPQPAVLEIY